MSMSQAVGAHIPRLRRFARALSGSQESGDAYVTAVLEALLADPTLVRSGDDLQVALYRLLLMVWTSFDVNRETEATTTTAEGVERNLQNISPRPRQAFLLTTLEGLTLNQAARAMLISEEKCQALIDQAGQEIAEQMASDVLIIEDEPLIALEVADVARAMGHTVRHVARTHREALAAVADHHPDLVLADIQLADGSSGLEAVEEILRTINVPAIFITAYPERLLTSKRPEPTYLIEKPFHRDHLKALIGQALFFHSQRR